MAATTQIDSLKLFLFILESNELQKRKPPSAEMKQKVPNYRPFSQSAQHSNPRDESES
jgi:hypothetical protein